MSDLPSSQNRHSRSTDPLRKMMKNVSFLSMKKANQSGVFAGSSENSFAILIPKRFLHGWWLLYQLRTLAPWRHNEQLREGADLGNGSTGSKNSSRRNPMLLREKHWSSWILGLTRFGRLFSCFSHESIEVHRWRTILPCWSFLEVMASSFLVVQVSGYHCSWLVKQSSNVSR